MLMPGFGNGFAQLDERKPKKGQMFPRWNPQTINRRVPVGPQIDNRVVHLSQSTWAFRHSSQCIP